MQWVNLDLSLIEDHTDPQTDQAQEEGLDMVHGANPGPNLITPATSNPLTACDELTALMGLSLTLFHCSKPLYIAFVIACAGGMQILQGTDSLGMNRNFIPYSQPCCTINKTRKVVSIFVHLSQYTSN